MSHGTRGTRSRSQSSVSLPRPADSVLRTRLEQLSVTPGMITPNERAHVQHMLENIPEGVPAAEGGADIRQPFFPLAPLSTRPRLTKTSQRQRPRTSDVSIGAVDPDTLLSDADSDSDADSVDESGMFSFLTDEFTGPYTGSEWNGSLAGQSRGFMSMQNVHQHVMNGVGNTLTTTAQSPAVRYTSGGTYRQSGCRVFYAQVNCDYAI